MTNNALINPAPIIHQAKGEIKSAIIWMHGLGANAHDFESIIPFLPIETLNARLIFPNAPERPVTINNGMLMPAWYDISDLALKNMDTLGIKQSNDYIQSLINEQIEQGIPSNKIVIAGFSQGGAMAIHAGTRCDNKLAGIMALSCYLLERNNHSKERIEVNLNTPIWMAHGTEDTVVPYSLAKSSATFLSAQGHKLTFVSYPMAHELCMPEIEALSSWLKQVLT